MSTLILAYPLGLEPRLTVLETAMLPLHYGYIVGGSSRIRTHGPFRVFSFQDCCLKPCSAILPLFGGCGWSRTNRAVRRKIYSLLGLPVFLHIHMKINLLLQSQLNVYRRPTHCKQQNLAMRGRVELPSSDRQSEIMTVI